MKICVVGAGAIGGILAFQFARAGHEVSVVARNRHLGAIQEHGLKMVNHLQGGVTAAVRLAASADPRDIAARSGVQDVVILGLKAHAIGPMLARIAPLVGAQTSVVPAINGVPWWYFYREGGPHEGSVVRSLDPHGTMLADLDSSHILGCVVHAAGEVREPGVIHYTGGKRFVIGEIDRSLSTPCTKRVAMLADAMNQAGLEGVVANDIRADVWAKLIGNLSFNPVAALTSSLMDRICDTEDLLAIIRPMLSEGMEVAARYGIGIGMTPDERIAVARQLGRAKISMHQDFESGRTPEIDAICGAVLELAERVDFAVPTIKMIDTLVRTRAQNLGLLPLAAKPS